MSAAPMVTITRRASVLVFALLAIVIAAAHGGALRGQFHYDDIFAIVENPAVRSWDPFRYFTSANAVISEANAAGYRPLTVVSLALNYQLGGVSPVGYLLANLLLHLAVSWMVFVVGRRLLGDWRWAGVAALVFALHPVNAEAVNYSVARSSLLSTMWMLVAFWAFLRGRLAGRVGWHGLGVGALLAAMLSKESAVAFVIPLAAYPWLSARWERAQAEHRAEDRHAGYRDVIPYLILAAAYVAFWSAMTRGGIRPPGPAAYPTWTFAEVVTRSLVLWVWPWPLGLDHPLTFLQRFDPWLAVGLVVFGAAWLAAVIVGIRRAPFAAWALLWVAAGFAPLAPLPWLTTVGLLQENRLVFSAVALAWLTAWGAQTLVARLRRGAGGAWVTRWVVAPIGLVLVIGAGGFDRARSAVWNDDARLWAEVVRRSPGNLLARINLGSAYMERKEFDRAEAEFRRVTVLAPDYPRAYYNLGLLALRRERYDDAKEYFLQTAEVAPGYAEAYHVLGAEALKRRRFEEARAAFQQAVALRPTDANAHAQLGLIALRTGDDTVAEREYLTALRDDPGNREVLNNVGEIYLRRRDWARALEYLTAALDRDPGFFEAAYNRGVALVGLGRRDEAQAVLRAVRPRLPSDPTFDPYRRGIDYLLAGGTP